MTDHEPRDPNASIERLLERLDQLDRPVAPSPAFARSLRARVAAELTAEGEPSGVQNPMQTLNVVPSLPVRPRSAAPWTPPARRRMARFEIAAAILLLLGFVAVLGGPRPISDRFTAFIRQEETTGGSFGAVGMYAGDAGRTWQQPGPAPEAEFVGSWSLGTEGTVQAASAPVVLGETVYRSLTISPPAAADGSMPTYLQAVDITTGTIRWQEPVNVIGSPAVTDDYVFVNTGGVGVGTPVPDFGHLCTLQAYDARTGDLLWTIPTGKGSGWSHGTSPLVIDDTVYAATPNGTVYAVEARTGKLLWTSTAATADDYDPARLDVDQIAGSGQLAGNEQMLIVVNTAGNIDALDRETGELRWSIDPRERYSINPGQVTPMVVKGMVILQISGIDLTPESKSGDIPVTVFATADATTGEHLTRIDVANAAGNAAIADGLLIVPQYQVPESPSGAVTAFDLGTAKEVWHTDGFDATSRGLSVAGDSIFLNEEHRLVVLDRADGSTGWSIPVNPAIASPAVVSREHVIIAEEDGTLRSFNTNVNATPIPDVQVDGEPTPTPIPAGVSGGTVAAMYGGDAGRTGRQAGPAPEAEFTRSWEVDVDPAARFNAAGPPIALNGVVYRTVTVTEPERPAGEPSTTYLQAIEIATGTLLWQTEADVIGAPAVTRDRVFANVMRADGATPEALGVPSAALQAFDAMTGTLLWTVDTGSTYGWAGDTSPIVIGNVVYAAMPDGAVYAIEGATGTVLWTSTEASNLPASVQLIGTGQIAADDTTLFVVSAGGRVVALDRATGARQWDVDVRARFEVYAELIEPIVVKELVVLRLQGIDASEQSKSEGSFIDVYVAIDGTTGEQLWRRPFAAIGGSPAVASGLLLVPSLTEAGGVVMGTDLATGEDAFEIGVAGNAPQAVTVAGNTAFVTDAENSLTAVDIENGARQWSMPLDASPMHAAAVSDGFIVVQGVDGMLRGFGSETGAVEETGGPTPTPEPANLDSSSTPTPAPANVQSTSTPTPAP